MLAGAVPVPTEGEMRGIAAILAVLAFLLGTWALLVDQFALALLALFVELLLLALAKRSVPPGANPHSLPRDSHFDR